MNRAITNTKFKTQLSHLTSSKDNLQTQRLAQKSDIINDLCSKFANISNQVTIDHDLSAFNLIEFNRKDLKMEYDQQFVAAKLKRLENNAELRRIEMEMENRKKMHSKRKHNDCFILPDKDKYINTYRDLTQRKIDSLFQNPHHRQNTDSEDQANGETERPKGITYFSQLKKHPKLLQFTVEQAKSKEKLKLDEINAKKQKIDEFKSELKTISNNPIFKLNVSKQKEKTTSPERVADNIFRRFYTRKNKQQSMDEARADSRVSSFLDKQQSIMSSVDQRSLSKENYQKLKQRMNNIANQLYDDEKKHKSKTRLPSIIQKRSTFATIAQ